MTTTKSLLVCILIGTEGFPTRGRVLWAAVWNEKTQKGKIVEFEVSPTSPSIFPGFGKVISMTQTIWTGKQTSDVKSKKSIKCIKSLKPVGYFFTAADTADRDQRLYGLYVS